ncbi:dihydrolipoyllysine-residue acetyltransferase [Pseudohalioglobus sediminis]|uniref:Acetyltransferase component of pyruvate dehydrogenase complex n=1 Tax=Pseudohalioglobus sediminis TaxID=2606449 RepID=A0A5B0X870_9GAMM|nr:dihydrolipoyllysine-residue acetyltransferase [Pseudohalioglobus sediminis]KAA1194561.1 dihydrolipoyllysine-residue acetyltransferase [Pseudohalioglobus sediminis]
MAKKQVTVPDIGGAEAEVIELLVAVGDEVAVDQGLIVLESDKASMEIPSTAAGVVVELMVSEGEQLAEGAPVVTLEVDGEEAEETASERETASGESEESADAAGESGAPAEPDAGTEAPAAETTAAGSGSGGESVTPVPVPDIGTEDPVELIEVCVRVGDEVSEGDSLVVLESDKASMEVPAPFAGEVRSIKVAEGDSVRAGDELLELAVAGDAAAGSTGAGSTTAGSTAAGSTAAPANEAAQAEVPAAAPSPREPRAAETAPAPDADSKSGVYAGPAVRKLAREFGIPLAEVQGSGPRGRLLKEDLHQFVQRRMEQGGKTTGAAAIPAIPEVDFAAFGKVEVTERSKLDKLTASNMQRSWLNVPHVTQYDDADITELETFRASLRAEAEQRGVKLTPMPFILKACAVALRDNPKFRSSLADGGESLVYKHYTHIGMAVDTPAGLLVPVIRDVDKKTIWELAEEVLAVAAKARDRKLMPGDMQGGCFTVSSLGNIGGRGFTPIVNAPEVGILGVSRAEIRPVWEGEEFVARKLLPLSLSYDHRVINGGDGGRFLTRLVALLGDIRQLVM